MKKIILCSDGTGNSGGGVNSNVWRLYEAIDVRVPQQVIFYDDGVGTQENKFLRALSSGTGIGVKQNVKDLYSFLLHQYDPGDQIYLFGFSRGAFTARVLSNLLFYCGIAKATNDQNERKTPQEIADLAEQAVKAYEAREFCDPRQGKPAQFRRDFGWRHESNVEQEPGWFPLHFVGVWDTVEAYGLPVDEMANALTMLGGFKLRFKEQGGLRENDLHPLLSNGFHAIATDDERHSFHPILWIENPPYDPDSTTREPVPGGEQVMSIGRNPKRNIQQVWFAGMHSNVGGGYPQDQMAHVSLLWMIEMATNCGLNFDPTLVELYQQIADSDGRMYDSRSGLAIYFRYRPRDLRVLCASAGLEKPTLHISVFQRLKRHIQDYAPTGIPAAYLVDPPHLPSGEVNPDARIALHDYVDELIWRRRILYYVFVGGTLHFLAWLWYFANHPIPLETESWCCAKLFVYYFFQPIMNTVEWSIPEYFKPGWIELGHRPWWVLGFVASFGFVYWRSLRLTKGIKDLSNVAWAEGFRPRPTPPLTATTRLRPPPRFKNFRTRYAAGASKFQQQWVPVLFIAALAVGVLALVYRWFEPLLTCSKPSSSKVQPTVQQLVAKFEFDTANPLFPAPISVEAGKRYHVVVNPHPEPHAKSSDAPWFDRESPASPDGVLKPDSFVFRYGNCAKRAPQEPWFKVLAAIGPDDQELIPVGSGCDITPKTSGRLFLFVNDVPFFYGNNHGKATVTVTQVD